MSKRLALVLTCEHAVDHIPDGYHGIAKAVAKHRGTHWAYDAGALKVARSLARQFGAPLFSGTISRLLLDLNRSSHHPRLLSSHAKKLPYAEQMALVEQFHRPHWHKVHAAIAAALAVKHAQVLHIAVHSFTPVWRHTDGRTSHRKADVGLLYDPRRKAERAFADIWQKALAKQAPQWSVRKNFPYLGRADGLPTATRRLWPEDRYLGFELELNQRVLAKPQRLISDLALSLQALLA